MAKVTSKLQVTIPKKIATQYAITPGDELDWIAVGDSVRLVPAKSLPVKKDTAWRLSLFDAATQRQRAREQRAPKKRARANEDRGWTREELYQRGGSG